MVLRCRVWAVLSVARFGKGLAPGMAGEREREREEKKEAFSQLQTNAIISKDIRSDKQTANEMAMLCLSHSGS